MEYESIEMDLTYALAKDFFAIKILKKNRHIRVVQGYFKNDFSYPLVMKKMSLKSKDPLFLKKYRLLEKSEAYLKEHLSSPIIPVLIAKKNRDKKIFLLESYIAGITLNQLFYIKNRENKLYERIRTGFLISQKENAYYLKETLVRLHRQRIIHGDINLKNLIINEKGRIYMIDFNSSIAGESLKESIFRQAQTWEIRQFNLIWKEVENRLYL